LLTSRGSFRVATTVPTIRAKIIYSSHSLAEIESLKVKVRK
jgi:hypothetical protein